MLHGAGMSLKDDLDLETTASPRLGDGPHEAIVRSRKDPSSSLHIPLPSAVNPGQVVPFIHQDLQLEGKLSALPFSSSAPVSSLNTVVDHALSAADLRRLRPKAICCVGCDREVAELSPNTVYKDLPSEHWAEMMEVWMCHADPTFTARLGQQTRDGFWPTKETVLVGGSYVLVDGGHAKKHNLCIETTEVSASLCVKHHPSSGLQEGHRHSPTGGLVTETVRRVPSDGEALASFVVAQDRAAA